MGKDLKYAIFVDLKGNAAKGIRDLGKELDALGKKGGAFGDFAKTFGGGIGGRITEALATRPGGIGGMLSDVIKGATSLALVPARILSSFASIIPGIGGIFSSVVGTAANILQGLVGIVANIVGGILNAFAALVGKVADIMGKVVGTVAKIGLGVGAAIGVALVKGVGENLKEMELKAILARRLGGGFAAAWAEIERQFGKTAFSQEELAGALTVLARADLKAPERLLGDIADAAVGARMPLEQVADLFLKLATAGGPEGEVNMGRLKFALREMGFDAATIEKIRTVDQLAGALRAKFGGLAQEDARLSPMKKLWQEIGELLETVSEPLTRAIIPAFARLNEWLDHLRDSPAIKKLADEIGRLATDAIGGLEHALDWLSTREFKWSNIVAGLKQAWQEGMPALGEMLLAAIRYAVAEAKVLLAELWQWMGKGITDAVQAALGTIAGALANVANEAQGMALNAVAKATFEKEHPGAEWAKAPPATALDYLTKAKPPSVFETLTGAPGAREAMGLLLGGGALGAGGALAGAAQKGIGDLSAKADAAAANLGALEQAAANAAAGLNAAAGQLGGAAAGAAETALPEAPGTTHKAGPEFGIPLDAMEKAAPADVRQVGVLNEAIQRGQAVQQALERAGYQQQAAQVGANVAKLRQTLESLLWKIIGDIGVLDDNVAALWQSVQQMWKEQAAQSQRIKNLATAR